MIEAKLRIVGGGERDKELDLQLPATIGRGKDNGITLVEPLVSRKHCEIYEKQDQLVVRDLGSLNGTYIGSQKIEKDRLLRPGELLTIGTVTFRAIYGELLTRQADHDGLDSASVMSGDTVDLGDDGTAIDPDLDPIPAKPNEQTIPAYSPETATVRPEPRIDNISRRAR